MARTKYKGTRKQPLLLYLVAGCSFMLASFLCVDKEFGLNITYDLSSPFRKQPPIKWRSRTQAISEAKLTRKPLLYAVLYKGDEFAYRLESDGLCQPEIYNYVNENFIPVKVPVSVQPVTDESLGKEFKGFTHQVNMDYQQSGLYVVPYRLLDASGRDIASTANLIELGATDPENVNHYGDSYGQRFEMGRSSGAFDSLGAHKPPLLVRYRDKEDLLEYLYLAKTWHTLKPTRGLVKWQPSSILNEKTSVRAQVKPRMLFLLADAGYDSDYFRLSSLHSKKLAAIVNSKTRPVLVEYHPFQPALDKDIEYLKKQYGVNTLPAVILLDTKDGKPVVQRGNLYEDGLIDFIESGRNKLATDSEQ